MQGSTFEKPGFCFEQTNRMMQRPNEENALAGSDVILLLLIDLQNQPVTSYQSRHKNNVYAMA
jgi:hypothetical protein